MKHTKNWQEKVESIARKKALNKNIYNPCNFFINNQIQPVNTFKISNKKEFQFKVEGFLELQEYEVFLYHIHENQFINTIKAEIDLICCNNDFKIIRLIHNCGYQEKINTTYIKYLWITKKRVH